MVFIYVPTPKQTPREYITEQREKGKSHLGQDNPGHAFWSTLEHCPGAKAKQMLFQDLPEEFILDLDNASGVKVIVKNPL